MTGRWGRMGVRQSRKLRFVIKSSSPGALFWRYLHMALASNLHLASQAVNDRYAVYLHVCSTVVPLYFPMTYKHHMLYISNSQLYEQCPRVKM